MKKALLIILTGMPAMLFAQAGKFTIKGKIADLNAPAKVYLVYNRALVDSMILNKGVFEFDGTIAQPTQAYLTLNKAGNGYTYNNLAEFYIEPGNIVIASPDSLTKARITGTKNNDDFEHYKALMAPLELRDDQLETRDIGATAEQKKSPQFLSELAMLNKQLEADRRAANKEFIMAHINSFASLDAMYSYAMYSDYNNVEALFKLLSPTLQNSPEGKMYAQMIENMQPAAIGNVAPDFELPDTNNNNIRLSSLRGKYVLLDFWASWCPVCRENNPGILKTYNIYKGRNFTVLGVSLDKPGEKQEWLNAIHHDGLTWAQVSELKFWQGKVVGLYNLTALPQNFLLDPDGKIIARDLDGNELSAKLAGIFKN